MDTETATTRYALVNGPIDTIRAYLPDNYSAARAGDSVVLIHGQDVAGWTLDAYVIPRLASGLYFARELDPTGFPTGFTGYNPDNPADAEIIAINARQL